MSVEKSKFKDKTHRGSHCLLLHLHLLDALVNDNTTLLKFHFRNSGLKGLHVTEPGENAQTVASKDPPT